MAPTVLITKHRSRTPGCGAWGTPAGSVAARRSLVPGPQSHELQLSPPPGSPSLKRPRKPQPGAFLFHWSVPPPGCDGKACHTPLAARTTGRADDHMGQVGRRRVTEKHVTPLWRPGQRDEPTITW